tara:strand:- start:17 stop:583 length:567 start_codon:yes stop_codon:yes gene_type:complete
MKIQARNFEGVYEITAEPIMDSRGFFMRTYDEKLFSVDLCNRSWVQENHSKSIGKNIIRGLHLQLPPYSETKLVRCVKGKILDVFVDLRKESDTFGKWDSIILSAENKKMIYIPRGFAHGFCNLVQESEVVYKVDNYYKPSHELGIIWNDKDLQIEWPTTNPILSEKDKNNYTLKEFIKKYSSININF